MSVVVPVELVDVLDVAEQHADVLWLQGQSAKVDDASQIILEDTTLPQSDLER